MMYCLCLRASCEELEEVGEERVVEVAGQGAGLDYCISPATLPQPHPRVVVYAKVRRV